MKRILFLIFFISTTFFGLYSQSFIIEGRVIDSKSKSPLAFVNILINEGKYGGTTDIDGVFRLASVEPVQILKLSYVGYEQKIYHLKDIHKKHLIKLQQKSFLLNEVIILAGENPAHRIIKNVIKNRKINDPEKLGSFSYVSYDKMIITSNIDSVIAKKDTADIDKDLLETKEFFDKQDVFLMETVTERKFMKPDHNYEHVIAQRVSGFQDPIFTFLVSQIQSTSFYKPLIHILNKHYVNPISSGSISKYFFAIEDTTFTNRGDTVFIISFKPRRGTKFDALQGVLFINSYKWAIQNVRTSPANNSGLFDIRIQQLYELIDDETWFPVQLNTDINVNPNTAALKVNEADEELPIVAIGKSYLKDIVLNPELVRKEFSNIEIEVDSKAHKRDEDYWNKYRNDPLTAKDRETYRFIDSIGKEAHLDEVIKTMKIIATGKIPVGFIDIDVNQFLNYNGYEGLHIGAGLYTNDEFSKWLRLGGFIAYGTKDKSFKYKTEASVLIDKFRELKIGASTFKIPIESGGLSFFDDTKDLIDLENARNLLIRWMNPAIGSEAFIEFRALRDFKFNITGRIVNKTAFQDYRFGLLSDELTITQNEFNFSEFEIGIRWAFKEKFFKNKDLMISKGTKYPVVWFQYTKGLDNFFNGDYDYQRFDLKIKKSFYTKYIGRTSIRLMAGLIDGDIPYCNLFNGNGSYRRFTIYAPYSFSTMRMNEFLSDRFAAIFFTHSFGKLLYKGNKFDPEIVVATNFGIGSLKNPERHLNIDFNTMEKGYYESGLLINDIIDLKIYNLGLGVFYRYGPYSLEETIDNFAFKFTMVFPFGNK